MLDTHPAGEPATTDREPTDWQRLRSARTSEDVRWLLAAILINLVAWPALRRRAYRDGYNHALGQRDRWYRITSHMHEFDAGNDAGREMPVPG